MNQSTTYSDGSAEAEAAASTTLAEVADRLAITELTSRLCLLVDSRDWPALEALFDSSVDVDYTSLNGGEPQTVSPADLVGGWRQLLTHLDATQHLLGGHVIEVGKDEASCTVNVVATHVLADGAAGPGWAGSGLYTVGGRYDFRLHRTAAGWRIRGMTLTVAWTSGSRHVMTLAAQGGAE